MKIQKSVRVENALYNEAKEVFSKFGLTFGDAVNIFLAKVSMEQAIPFELSLPSEKIILTKIKTPRCTKHQMNYLKI